MPEKMPRVAALRSQKLSDLPRHTASLGGGGISSSQDFPNFFYNSLLRLNLDLSFYAVPQRRLILALKELKI